MKPGCTSCGILEMPPKAECRTKWQVTRGSGKTPCAASPFPNKPSSGRIQPENGSAHNFRIYPGRKLRCLVRNVRPIFFQSRCPGMLSKNIPQDGHGIQDQHVQPS